MAIKYSKEQIEEAARDSKCVADVVKRLGLVVDGNSHGRIKKAIARYSINIDHFSTSQVQSKNGKEYHNKKEKRDILGCKDILVNNRLGYREKSDILRKAMLDSGFDYKCKECELGDYWNGKQITLQINHIDGDPLNNNPDNIEFLCPNCHSQTTNFNIKKELVGKESKVKNNRCNSCNKKISRNSKICKRCSGLKAQRTKIDWPPTDELLRMIKESSMNRVAKQLGVSFNAVKKRIKNHPVDNASLDMVK